MAPSLYAQQRSFDVTDASKYFDIKINASKCDADSCTGRTVYSFHKKGSAKAYQVVTMPDTYIDISEGAPVVNETLLYDKQSVLTVDDFNFDGMEDVAISDGQNGSYHMPSFNVYLSSRAAGKFVYNEVVLASSRTTWGCSPWIKRRKCSRPSTNPAAAITSPSGTRW